MKNKNSNSVATVILISLLTGCSGISHARTAVIFQPVKKTENTVSKFSTLASIAIAEFGDCTANSDMQKSIFIHNTRII